jgi:hypothetical protein
MSFTRKFISGRTPLFCCSACRQANHRKTLRNNSPLLVDPVHVSGQYTQVDFVDSQGGIV